MGERWSHEGGAAQVSAFLRFDSLTSPDDLGYVEYQLLESFSQESIEVTSANPSARLIASCYSAGGSISVYSEYGKVDLSAIGVGGDFFLFHEEDLICGSYISADDWNQDYCILDESAAWKLFGSSDIAGQIIYVGNIPLIVKGVVKMPDSNIYKRAGLKNDFCFITYDFLLENGTAEGVSTYEVVMPNPVPGYAISKLQKYINASNDAVVLVDNTTRFGFINLLKNLKDIKYRAMDLSQVAYPYWENVARYELDRLSVLTLIYLIFATYAIIMLVVIIVILIVVNRDGIAYLFKKLFSDIREFLVSKTRREEF